MEDYYFTPYMEDIWNGDYLSKKTGYDKVSLPSNLITQIRAFIKNHPDLAYNGVPDFVKESIRMNLLRHTLNDLVKEEIERQLKEEDFWNTFFTYFEEKNKIRNQKTG